MQNQIYLLDSEIYTIRCYAGEIINFIKIRSGENADIKDPVVIYQKLRFLDEDLARITSIYEIQWGDIDMFEDFLRHSPAAIDLFVPATRCVSLVRISRTGTMQGADTDLPFQNLMRNYDYYHGHTVGILIRNGENLYLGWTDESRVHIEDDLLLSKAVTVGEVEPQPEYQTKYEFENAQRVEKENRKKIIDGIISRSFVYNILQGVVDRTSILPLPDGIKLNKPSQYVVYSMADNWLTDNRFDSFSEIMELCNNKVSKGDTILTMQRLVAERDWSMSTGYASRAYENVRGRGELNRTHDCEVKDCTFYPVNLVETDDPRRIIRYERNGILYQTTGHDFDRTKIMDPDVKKINEYEVFDRHVFISVKKQYSRSGTARANFEICDDEFLNLTYMNSVWLEWCINNKKLGNWKIKGVQVIYSYGIRYLNKALEFVRNREKLEKELLDAVDLSICLDPDWPLKLAEWKMENNVREITPYQAKRFAKHNQH